MKFLKIFNKNKEIEKPFSKSKYDFMSWEHRNPVQPETISYPHELEENQHDLRLAITQNNISASEQRKLIDEWCDLLGSLDSVKQIFFYSRVNQKIFDTVCEMKQLDSLFIKWSGNSISSFQNLNKLRSLRRLYLGSSSTLDNLDFFEGFDNLKWLEIHEQKNLNSLIGMEKLTSLKGFKMSGGIHGKQKINDVKPFHSLAELEYLNLASTYIASEDLSPICHLSKLEYLDLPIYYPMEEFANLFKALPNCDHGIKAFRESDSTCTKCGNESMVYPMNKRSRQICKNCESEKIKKWEMKFESLIKTAPNNGYKS